MYGVSKRETVRIFRKNEKVRTVFALLVPLTEPFSNLLLEGIERLWEVHEFLPNPKRFPLAPEERCL
jgi:hypothetical protein